MRTLLCLLALAAPLLAQNIVVNGDFSQSTPAENLWDGVNSAGGLAGELRDAYALTEAGPPGLIKLPVSVNFADMNGDGLPDLVTADPAGTMRVYFNSGSKTEPKFTYAETVPLYLSRPAKDEEWDDWGGHGMAKISMYDWNRSGSVDLLFGNYAGDIVFIPNSGTAASPNFPQPPSYAKATIPTSKKGQLWGNLFAPCVYDWNKDGKPDLLIGEGSYSANAVHVLLNEGSGTGGKFTDESRHYLCYGDGREHLVPTVADWNGDGEPDVLVGDRSGAVAVHLRQPNWKPGDEVKFSHFVDFAGIDRLNVAVAPFAADYNGDGLFDLLIGRADGRIQVALNKGTKGQPKFERPVDVKGTDLWGKNILNPNGWTTDNGNIRGNLYGYVTATDQPSPGGGKVLKMGYWPSPNKIIKLIHPTVSGRNTTDFFRNYIGVWLAMDARRGSEYKPTNAFVARQLLQGLNVGGSYNLSFKVRGKRMTDGAATIALLGVKEVTPTKFEKKERGANAVRNEKKEEILIEHPMNSGSTWANVTKSFTVTFKEKELKALSTPTFAILEFKTYLAQYDGECEICDVQITPGK